MQTKGRKDAKSVLSRLIQGGIQTHSDVANKDRNADVVSVFSDEVRVDLLVAIGGACADDSADGLGATAILSVFPV